jgi:dipeptidyl aminopeptidase/acylaminoacyl peptidase
MKKYILTLVPISLFLFSLSQDKASVSFEKWLSLKQAGGVVLSPDGKQVCYSVTSTDWANNTYDAELWLSRDGSEPFQLTQTPKGNSNSPQFTPDSKWISFLADRGNKTQLYLISVFGGEAFPITKEEEGIGNYRWSPDGKQVAFTRTDPESKNEKSTKERYGAYGVEGEEFRQNHLWVLPFHLDSIQLAGLRPCYPARKDSTSKDSSSSCFELPKAIRLTEGKFSVGGFDWSPDSKQIAFTKLPDPLINSGVHADIAILNLADKKWETIISNPAGDFFQSWSPDGKALLYYSTMKDSTTFYYSNNRIFIFNLGSRSNREILTTVDENKNIIDWNPGGIYFSAAKKMQTGVYRYVPGSVTTEFPTGMEVPGGVSLSRDGSVMALSGRSFDGLNEIWIGKTGAALTKLTNMTNQLNGWKLPRNEIISWKSKDGQVIEGVLLKPGDYNPSKNYPLLVIIHGGPTGIDRPEPAPTYVYPVVQWCEKGALVLRVNYRGSAGYGEAFRSLNVKNLGVGDMWDVMSGVDYLAKQGWIDTSRMGCMGWSQGGYISAFLTTNTNRFKAISVGAGISNWVTYYVNTDITPFTRQYLQATPWDDMNVYLKTSPMTQINKASTPTLIQHGEFDRRVPIPNAYELYRGLQDRKIPSRLIVYKGFGHGINKPRERLAAVWHNWQWFNHYVWGEPMEEMPGD